jgi:hypothetical protein
MALCVRSFHLSSPPFGVWQHRCAFEKRLKNAPFMASFYGPNKRNIFIVLRFRILSPWLLEFFRRQGQMRPSVVFRSTEKPELFRKQ